MTTAVAMPESRPGRAPRRGRRAPGQAAVLCLQMLRTGLLWAHLGLAAALVVALSVWQGLGAANAAIAGAIVIAFFASGQGVQMLAGELAGGTGMVLVMLSYLLRVGALAGLLWLAMSHQARLEAVFVRPAFFLGAALTLTGWLAGVLWRGAHQQVLAWDSDFDAGARGAARTARGDLADNGRDSL